MTDEGTWILWWKWPWGLKIYGKKWRTSRETSISTRDKKSRIKLEKFLSRTEVPYKDVALNQRINGGLTIPHIQRHYSEFCVPMKILHMCPVLSVTHMSFSCNILVNRFGFQIKMFICISFLVCVLTNTLEFPS